MRDFHLPGRSTVHALNGMCATSHPLAAQVAVAVLADGGNAADAAISAAVLLGLCEPQMTGIGGDCFALVKPAGSEEIVALNGSGRAPAGADADALRGAGHRAVPIGGVEAVTIPGAVDAFCRLNERYGRKPLADLLAPAIRYAEEGIPVAPRTAFDWAVAADHLKGAARDHYLLGGEAPVAGQVFRAPAQAEVLRRVAAEGRAGFYEGEVLDDMLAALGGAGGGHRAEDFAAAEATWHEPISGDYGGTELVEHPPNGQGATAILMAGMARRLGWHDLPPLSAERVHVEAEIAKLAYDARDRLIAYGADPARMLSGDLADALCALVDPARARPDPRGRADHVHKETVYLTVVDGDRMAVSLIYSIFHSFGSGIASGKFGILFQNRGAGFTLEEGHPNVYGPGKRPMHTIIPAMTRRDGRVEMSFGVMGGQYQPNGHLRVLSNMVDHGMDPQEALDAPRAFASEGRLGVERGYPEEVRARLAEMGHDVHVPDTPIGGAQVIRIGTDGVLTGASDPRKDGCALGL